MDRHYGIRACCSRIGTDFDSRSMLPEGSDDRDQMGAYKQLKRLDSEGRYTSSILANTGNRQDDCTSLLLGIHLQARVC